jgi:hypothetical protein
VAVAVAVGVAVAVAVAEAVAVGVGDGVPHGKTVYACALIAAPPEPSQKYCVNVVSFF